MCNIFWNRWGKYIAYCFGTDHIWVVEISLPWSRLYYRPFICQSKVLLATSCRPCMKMNLLPAWAYKTNGVQNHPTSGSLSLGSGRWRAEVNVPSCPVQMQLTTNTACEDVIFNLRLLVLNINLLCSLAYPYICGDSKSKL